MLISLIVALVTFPLEVLYWIRWILAYVAIRIYNSSHPPRLDLYDLGATGDPEKLGYLAPQLEIDLESPQSETHLQEAADEVLFYGVNSDSECLLVRITRGCNQAAEAWIYLKLANGKIYQQVEHANYQQPFEGKCLSFTCGNLEMYYLLPMRKWRIHFSGSLKEKNESGEAPEKVVFVKFVFLWSASSDVYDFTLDSNPKEIVDAVASTQWENSFSPPINKLQEALSFYAQVGTIRGTVSIDEGPEIEMYLFGERTRSLGNSSMIAGCNFTTLLGYVPQNGLAVHLMNTSAPKMFKNLPVGFVVKPDGEINPLKDLDFTLKPFNSASAKKDFQASFNTGEKYHLNGALKHAPTVLYSGQGWSGFLELSVVQFTIKNKTGYGLILTGEVYEEPTQASVPLLHVLFPKTVPLTVKFTDEISHFGDISGGKGSSLGKLTKLSETDKTFVVPKGLIVTTSAYDAFVTNDIKNYIKDLENVAYGNLAGDVKEYSEIVSRNIVNTTLPDKICQSIIADLKSIFGNTFKDRKFAVRSSATGEDTDVMSAAGQMDTYLGINDLQEIFIAVKKCWASQFGHIAVEYKRQNGQMLNTPMAVVIQEMVACDVSGVLFTCDPVTNNPNFITITANYGLGETVVSGSVEPDTIILQRNYKDELEIKSVNIGAKHQRIVMQESGGVITENLPEDSKTESCITGETSEMLAKLAITVEKYYRSCRDIEWGIRKGKVYLLQSRPVTSGCSFTDFEIKHEFDSPLRCERDSFTVANVGEVWPGASSPLGMEMLLKYFCFALVSDAHKKGLLDLFSKSTYYNSGIVSFYNHIMLSVPELICRHGHGTTFSKGFEVSIFGRFLDDPDLEELAKEKIPEAPRPSSVWKLIWNDFNFLKDLLTYDKNMEYVKQTMDSYDLHFTRCKTSEEAFDALMRSCSDFNDAPVQHMKNTEHSSHWNIIMFLILMRSKGRFDTDVYSDFGKLLAASSDVESADIPSSMQAVASQIAKDLGVEKFKSMSLEDSEKWLTTSSTLAGQLFRQFIRRHGHRCLKEFDVHSIPWNQDPKILINLLKTIIGTANESSTKEVPNYATLFSELRTPLDFLHRFLLKIVIPGCQKGVRAREAGKSSLIKSIDHWRKGFQHVAKLMVAEGRLPDQRLIFFMTMEEIRALLKTRYPRIISRANQRRKFYPILDQYIFPEITKGFPKPINEDDDSSDSLEFVADLTMQGIPVSQGVTKGYARVCVSVEEAASLKPGEILIAYSTDIGWSPYFPIIAGVVTELGGLISHGAVVSREYGLPCVVGLQGATKKFKTGDYVLLDGKKGILQRLPHP